MSVQAKQNLQLASSQWASREPSARFWDLAELYRHLLAQPADQEVTARWDDLKIHVVGDDLRLTTGEGRGRGSNGATFTNHGFSQFCSSVKVPFAFLTGTCADNPHLAADCLNQGIKVKASTRAAEAEEKEDDSGESVVMLTRRDATPTIRATYSTKYARVPDSQVVKHLMEFGDGWHNPPARPSAGDDPRQRIATKEDVLACCNQGIPVTEGMMIAPAGVYCDDRSMFAFLVDSDNPLDDGNGGSLFHGICVKNSETCTERLTVVEFIFEGVCSNHIIWGASDVTVKSLKHRGDTIIAEWQGMLTEALQRYRGADIGRLAEVYAKAKTVMLGTDEDDVVKVLGNNKALGLGKRTIRDAFALAVQFQPTYDAPPVSAWGMVHGLTRLSQVNGFTDARTKMDVAAGKIIDSYVVTA